MIWLWYRAILNRYTLHWFTKLSSEFKKCLIYSISKLIKAKCFQKGSSISQIKILAFYSMRPVLKSQYESVLIKWIDTIEKSHIWIIAQNVSFHLREVYYITRYNIKVMATDKKSKNVKNEIVSANLMEGKNSAASQGNKAIQHS